MVTCATEGEENNLFCWGANDDRGQLGDDTTTDKSLPVSIPYEAVGASNGFDNTCAVVLGGVNPDFAVCMGANDFGQLGNGKTNTGVAHSPVKVKNLPGTPVQSRNRRGFQRQSESGRPFLRRAHQRCGVLLGRWRSPRSTGHRTTSATPVEVSLSGAAKPPIVGSDFACCPTHDRRRPVLGLRLPGRTRGTEDHPDPAPPHPGQRQRTLANHSNPQGTEENVERLPVLPACPALSLAGVTTAPTSSG